MLENVDFKLILERGDLDIFRKIIALKPHLANDFIYFGLENKHTVHPLHYVCDCVFEYKIVEIVALEMVKEMLKAGADINGNAKERTDTPLIAASSLYCDQVALFLLADSRINIAHKGTHGGTALHWAAWTGSYLICKKLIEIGAITSDISNDFGASPLHWAVNGMVNTSVRNKRNQLKVIQLLLENGLSPLILDNNNKSIYEIAQEEKLIDVLQILSNC